MLYNVLAGDTASEDGLQLTLFCHAGIREYAKAHNASIGSIEESEVERWLNSARPVGPHKGRSLTAADAAADTAPDSAAQHAAQDTAESPSGEPAYSLFGYPAYDNYAGVMYPLSWVKEVQARSNKTHVWKVGLVKLANVGGERWPSACSLAVQQRTHETV